MVTTPLLYWTPVITGGLTNNTICIIIVIIIIIIIVIIIIIRARYFVSTSRFYHQFSRQMRGRPLCTSINGLNEEERRILTKGNDIGMHVS